MPLHGVLPGTSSDEGDLSDGDMKTWTTTQRPNPDVQYFVQGKNACYRKVPADKIMDEKCDWASSWPIFEDPKCAPHVGKREPNGGKFEGQDQETHAKDLGFAANCRNIGNETCNGYAYDNLIQYFNKETDTPYKWCIARPQQAATPESSNATHQVRDWDWYDVDDIQIISDASNSNGYHTITRVSPPSKNTISRSYNVRYGYGETLNTPKPNYNCVYTGFR